MLCPQRISGRRVGIVSTEHIMRLHQLSILREKKLIRTGNPLLGTRGSLVARKQLESFAICAEYNSGSSV